MDKKLEARIVRLEKLLKAERRTSKNEELKKHLPAKFSWRALEYDIGEKDSFDINDILGNYARVGSKPKKILKELLASGDMDEWAKECACSTEELYSSIEQSMYDYDDTSSITLEGRDGDTAKCKVVLPDGKAFTVYMPVYTSESDFDDDDDMDEKLEARIARLENFIGNKSAKNESADVNELISVANFFDEASSSASNYLSWLPEELDDELEEELINFQQAARHCRDILNKDYIKNDYFINKLGKWANM